MSAEKRVLKLVLSMTKMNRPFVLREIYGDDVFRAVRCLVDKIGDPLIGERCFDNEKNDYFDAVCKMAANAEKLGTAGNPWLLWLAKLFSETEMQFALAHERMAHVSGSLKTIILEELEDFVKYISLDFRKVDEFTETGYFSKIADFKPLHENKSGTSLRITILADNIGSAKSAQELYVVLEKFYASFGVGQYAAYNAFRWDKNARAIVPVTNTEKVALSDIIGYDEQKQLLCDNTEAFVEGRPANNVLLYGESGTGKSTSIKAIMNEYAERGLRVVEVYKHQIEDLDEIISIIKNRNYRFILFMDDLSFEQFEIEYKYLKSFIEGGLEKRPDNVLIYATSNRRHLMKESWKDKEDMQEDMHESETMQEKMSLVDRFGLLIRYISPAQREYLNIVHALAAEYGIEVNEELDHGAIRWELQHGGFSGRAARQFVEHAAGKKK